MKQYRNTSIYLTEDGKVFGPRGERKLGKNNRGYLMVNFIENGKRKFKTVHRMMAETYLGKSNLEVNHKDKDRTNNHIDNLEWVTRKENCKNIDRKHLIKLNDKLSKYIDDIKYMYSIGFTQKEISIKYNVNQSAIHYRLKEA
jgi:hypothetical protein